MKKTIIIFLVIILLLMLQLERQNIKLSSLQNKNEEMTIELENIKVTDNSSLEARTERSGLISLDERIYSNTYGVYNNDEPLDKKSSFELANSFDVEKRTNLYSRYARLWKLEKDDYIYKISENLSNDRLKEAFSDSNKTFSDMVISETERLENVIMQEENLDEEEIEYTRKYIDYIYSRSRALMLKDTYNDLISALDNRGISGNMYEIDILLNEQLSYEYTTMGISVTFDKYADLWKEEVNDDVKAISDILKTDNERQLFLKSHEKWQQYNECELTLEDEANKFFTGNGTILYIQLATNRYLAYKNRSIELKEMYDYISNINNYEKNIETINLYENDIYDKFETSAQKEILENTKSAFYDYTIAQNEFYKALNSDNSENVYYKMYKNRAYDLEYVLKRFSGN